MPHDNNTLFDYLLGMVFMHSLQANIPDFREIFFVQEPVLVVPKLYVNIQSCTLRVIDNDSGEQLPMVFMRVKPRVLQKNKVILTIFAIFVDHTSKHKHFRHFIRIYLNYC